MATTTLNPAAPAYRNRLYEWLTTTDHKKIGMMYLINSMVFFVAGGILEVQPNLITVLADTAIRGHDLDEAKALEAHKRAQENLASRTGKMEYTEALAELAQAAAQIAAIRKLRSRK